MKRIILLWLAFYVATESNAQQNCWQRPAPCPDETLIENVRDVERRTKDNDAFPQQLQMEENVRNVVTDEIQRIAKANGWEVYELREDGMDRPPFIYISYGEWEATPFEKRPPSRYQVTFIFITSKDSLQAWKDYLVDDIKPQSDQLIQQYSQSQNDNALIKTYQDSVLYYSQQLSDLMQKDYPAYMKALQDKDEKGINAYEYKQKAIQKKVDYFTKKLQEIQNGSNKNFEDAQAEWAKQIVAFAEGSMALVHFDINPYFADFALDNVEENNLSQHNISIPDAFYASITNNRAKPERHNYDAGNYDFTFQNPSCVASVLFGNFLPKTKENRFPAAFAKNFHDKQSVIGSVKIISCEKIQNLQVHVEGGSHYVNEIIRAMDWKKLSGLIYK